MHDAEQPIEELVYLLSKLPGMGKRSARRVVLHMIKHREQIMYPLADTIKKTADNIHLCELCHNIDTISPCGICTNEARDHQLLCVVEEVSDLWAIERSNSFKGIYHVLGGVLSGIDGIGPEDLTIAGLLQRVQQASIKELVLATGTTVDGQTTAHYITNRIRELSSDIVITRIAQGIPIGGELDYLDDGTLGTALSARRPF